MIDFDPHWASIFKVVFSIFLGSLIGLEREIAAKPAGLRTHMLVAGASALFVILGEFMIHLFTSSGFTGALRADPIRIMEAIITGISFLGAGTIIFKDQQSTVEGLTTAASILFVSGIGIAVAINKIVMASILTVVAFTILFVVGISERWIKQIRMKSISGDKDSKSNV